MRVLLIQPPFEDFFSTPIRFYPLGLLYVAEIFERAGFEVGILDCLLPLRKRRMPIPKSFSYIAPFLGNPYFFKGYYRFGMADDEIVSRIRAFSPDLIGISSQFTAYFQSVEELSSLIKRNFAIPLFVGGNHATAFPSEIKRRAPAIDFVLTGPAEDCLPEFFQSLGYVSSKEELDWREILPAHHLLQANDYKIGRENYISLISSRGCPFRCEFCSVHQMFGREINYRPVDSVLEEMRWNYDKKGVRIFNFEDDNLSFDRSWFSQFLDAVSSDPLLKDIELTAMNGLCSVTLDEEILSMMRRAGFRQLNLSLVTQSPELQEKLKRPRQMRNFEQLIRTAQKLGFFVTVYVIIGLPSQTYEEVKKSIDYLLGLGVLVGPSIFYMASGSPLYDRLKISAEVKSDWNLYRSSAFAVETDEIKRDQLLELFIYVRKKNLENKMR